MADKILKLNNKNELVAENTNDGSTEPVNFGSIEVLQSDTRYDWFNAESSGIVASGDFGIIQTVHLEDGQSIEVTEATYISLKGDPIEASPSGTELSLATSSAIQQTVLSGDGTTVNINVTGNPVTSYENTTGSSQQIMIGIDNGNFGSGAGADIDIQMSAIFRVVN